MNGDERDCVMNGDEREDGCSFDVGRTDGEVLLTSPCYSSIN